MGSQAKMHSYSYAFRNMFLFFVVDGICTGAFSWPRCVQMAWKRVTNPSVRVSVKNSRHTFFANDRR